MANGYDNALLYPKQIKLFKFYDLSTSKIVSAVAENEEQARRNLSNSFLIFIVRKHIFPATEQSIMWGGMIHV